MKALTLLAAGLVASVFAACASSPSQTPDQIAIEIHTQVAKACMVATPTIASLDAMKTQMTQDQSADLAKVEAIVIPACSAQSVSVKSVQDLVNVAMPLAIKIIASSPMKDADKTTAEIALTAASVAVSAVLAQYAPAVAVPASAASGV